jgi:hypothetical protein
MPASAVPSSIGEPDPAPAIAAEPSADVAERPGDAEQAAPEEPPAGSGTRRRSRAEPLAVPAEPVPEHAEARAPTEDEIEVLDDPEFPPRSAEQAAAESEPEPTVDQAAEREEQRRRRRARRKDRSKGPTGMLPWE